MFDKPALIAYGDTAILVKFSCKGFSRKVVNKVHALAQALRPLDVWEELVPGYDSLLVKFNPAKTTMDATEHNIETTLKTLKRKKYATGRVVEIPVCYGGEFGPDMDNIKASSGLSEAEIIKRHSHEDYLVCILGFIPGFTFLSKAPRALHHPRHSIPRTSIPAGSIGIAGWQTGIYGLESPGGWQLIGRTPLKLFEKSRPEPFLLSAGDTVKFVPTAHEAFHA